jgi:hypothetical protein
MRHCMLLPSIGGFARALALILAAATMPLLGCADDLRLVNLVPGTGENFTFSTGTNTVMTENDDGVAERIRREWLAQSLSAAGMCRAGYVIDSRWFLQPEGGLFANGGDILCAGRCL